MSVDLDALNRRLAGSLPGLLGIRFVEATLDRLVAELEVRDELMTGRGSRVHGGTLMAFADTVGAVATVINLPEGAGTTTLESKTNFLAAGNGTVLRLTEVQPAGGKAMPARAFAAGYRVTPGERFASGR